MKTVAARIDLGMTRIAGYILYDPQTMEFHETTPKEVERLVKQGQVNGLVLNDNGELVPDLEGWNLGNIKIKSGVGNYRNWNTQDSRSDTIYSVVRAVDVQDAGRIYEVINNRCGRIFFSRKHLVALSTMAWIGGIRVNDEDDTIELCKGVQVDDWSTRKAFELGSKVMNKEQLTEQTMEELFAQVGQEAQQAQENGEPEQQEGQEAGEDRTPNLEQTEAEQQTGVVSTPI